MNNSSPQFIPVSELRIGLFVYIDLGWLFHPFPLNAFKIRTQEQIDTIHSLGIDRIRYDPDKSDPPGGDAPAPSSANRVLNPVAEARRQRLDAVARQRASLKVCERGFTDASQAYRQVSEIFRAQPEAARQQAESLVKGVADELLGEEESNIRLLSEQVGERSSLHSINVTVISMLLGKALRFPAAEMAELGMGALLHDVGKYALPNRLRWRDEHFTRAELLAYQDHVVRGLEEGRRMGLPAGVLLILAQHHETADGKGFPNKVDNSSMCPGSRVVALVNQYDNLCNPNNPSLVLTPHEALSHLFVQQKTRFDGAVLGAFIRMMGIYPPGSVVQLTDDRFALVVSVNSHRPLKPQVIIHQPEIPADEALIVDLEGTPELGIRRSLKPLQLPRAALDYLSPRERICYFFERAREPSDEAAGS
jgi:putative nucleotidyltransferase with HDIG domain